MTRRRSRALLRGPLEPVRDPPACGLCREPCRYGGVEGHDETAGWLFHASCWALVSQALRAVRALGAGLAAACAGGS